MTQELDKINAYFDEAQKLWSVNPEMVISQKFFELWEEVQQPRPFRFTNSSVTLMNSEIALLDDSNMIGCFAWDWEEECGGLYIEGERSIQKVIFPFEDGVPRLLETPTEFFDDIEIPYGERLEVIYDILAHINRNNLPIDPLQLSKKQYLDCLDEIAGNNDPVVIRVMKKLTLRSVFKLARKALDDMAIDEVGTQLSLPLEGSYSSSTDKESNAQGVPSYSENSKSGSFVLHERTYWTILNDLECLNSALQLLSEFEEVYAVPLTSCRILKECPKDKSVTLRIPVGIEIAITEGETLVVYSKGEKEPVGATTH